jgi:hypothetical protein
MYLLSVEFLKFVPAYFQINLLAYITKNTISTPFPINYTPNLLLPSKIFCLQCNQPPLVYTLYNTSLVKKFEDEVKENNTLDVSVKSIILSNIVFYISIILQCNDDKSIENIISSVVPITFTKNMISVYIQRMKMLYNDIFNNIKSTEKFLQDVFEFYKAIYTVVLDFKSSRINISVFEIMPCHLPTILKNRLLLVSLLPQKIQLKYHINKLTAIDNCCGRFINNFNTPINIETFLHCIKSITIKEINHSLRVKSISHFEKIIWKGHLFKPPKLLQDQEYFFKSEFDYKFTDDQILAQILCFVLPNWEEIWFYMDWPKPLEICKRLNYLKEVEKWIPDYISISSVLLLTI